MSPKSTTVPFVDLASQHAEVAAEVEAGIAAVFAATAFVDGPPVADFEHQYASFVQVDHCVGVANGTDALELALRAAGVGPGGEVVIPANTFIATAEAVSRIGAVPVLVDCDDERLLIDPDQVGRAITDRTRAVVAVHLFGQLAPMERLAQVCGDAGVPLVEDAAQSQGARLGGRGAGALGTVAATSFYPGKNLGAAGDAGAVTTDDATIAAEVRRLRNHGSSTRYVHDVIGMNSRLDTVQAVYLRAKLDRLEKWNELRVRAAARYDRLLVDVDQEAGERRSTGGIVIPATAAMGARRLAWSRVIAVGPHARAVEVGDRVLFDPEDKAEVEVHGEVYVVMRERDVHAVAAERLEGGSTGLYL
ncbi:hypothetical protein Pve01_74190 [Planomonospora venezuelensis]|nr:hypothetical protein Pve01_74190 [Planomonospora venezuelensis]